MRRQDQWLSSLPLQMTIFCDTYACPLYLLILLCCLIYKGIILPYPQNGVYGWEVAFLFIYALVEGARLYVGSKGNKLERMAPLIYFVLLSVGVIIADVYYMLWQVYVLQIDYVMCAIMLSLHCLMATLGIWTIARINRMNTVG